METDSSQGDQDDNSEARGQYYQYQKDDLLKAVEKIRNNELWRSESVLQCAQDNYLQ